MDLLGDYGSDSDGSSNCPLSNRMERSESVPLLPDRVLASSEKSFATLSLPSQSLTSSNKLKQNVNKVSSNKKNNNVFTKRGKKLLSLNAVLPPDIFERLTRGGAGTVSSTRIDGFMESSESESEFSPDSVVGKIRGEKNIIRKAFNSNKTRNEIDLGFKRKYHSESSDRPSQDTEINSLLADLKRNTPQAKPVKIENQSISDQKLSFTSSPMGMAFLQSSSTTVIRKKGENNSVEDVHVPAANNNPKQVFDKKDTKSIESSEKLPQKRVRPDDIPSKKEVATKMISSTPSISVPIPRPSFQNSIHIPLKAKIHNHISNSSHETVYQPQYTTSKPTVQINTDSASNLPTSQSISHKKRSKRDIEKALRSADFSSLENYDDNGRSSIQFRTIDSNSLTSSYELPTEELHISSQYSVSRIKKPQNLQVYDPKAGKAVALGSTEDGGNITNSNLKQRHKSKHQIHSLVASAVSLESQRYRVGGPGAIKKGSSSRVDAKKKYGW
mmetsp:Transcript_10600/g.14958  ORF Transcript_10600/g.14958 Transcript_10600/m.14958 type:complete len:500 (+) Transcript_10600:73-1572(+)